MLNQIVEQIENDELLPSINETTQTNVDNEFVDEIDLSLIELATYTTEKCIKTSSNSYSYSFTIGRNSDDNDDNQLSPENVVNNINNNINTIEPMISNLSIQQSHPEQMQLSSNSSLNDYPLISGQIEQNFSDPQSNLDFCFGSSSNSHQNDLIGHLYDYQQYNTYNSVSNDSYSTHQSSINEDNQNLNEIHDYEISNPKEMNPKRKFDITNNDSGVLAGDLGSSLCFPTGNTLKRHRNSSTLNNDNDVNDDDDYEYISGEEVSDSNSTALDLSLNTINNEQQQQQDDHLVEGHFLGNTSINSEHDSNSHDNHYLLSDLHSKVNGVEDGSYLNQCISN